MISVIIPTYKNTEGFLVNLKHNYPYLKGCEIIVVNDNPDNDLTKKLAFYPNVLLIQNTGNLGFAKSINIGVQKCHGKYLLLLNDDVLLYSDNFNEEVKLFEQDNILFTISFAQKDINNNIVGKNKICWQHGLFFHKADIVLVFGETGWADGGSCLIDKNKFLELKGFDEDYSPFYWEDMDLSYRAKLKGWKVFFDPKVLVEHHHETTIGKTYKKRQIEIFSFRNQFIFTWKNVRGLKMWLQHLVFLPYNMLYYLLKGKASFVIGFIKALFILIKSYQSTGSPPARG